MLVLLVRGGTRRVRVSSFIKLTFKPGNALFITSFLRTVLERNLAQPADTYFYIQPSHNRMLRFKNS